jgi:hypothetical protein
MERLLHWRKTTWEILKNLGLWDTATGKVLYRLTQRQQTSHTFVFSADGGETTDIGAFEL